MRLQLLSDLHLETETFDPTPAPGAEALVLAGDVDASWAGFERFARWPVPVWLVGTSMGTVSAASAAARLGNDGPDGLVLISSVTRTHPAMRESLADIPLESIQVPTLILHHRQDPCEITPYDDALALPRRLTRARRVEFVALDGGPPAQGLPCGPESPHAFVGMEDVLIDRLASWITRTPVR